MTSNSATLHLAAPSPWWDTKWPYRVELLVGAAGFVRTDHIVSVGVNFTEILDSVGEPGTFDPNSVRIVEVDANGAVIDDYIQYQFEGVSAYNATTNADGQVVFPLEGTTAPTQTRRYYMYFAKTGAGVGTLQQPSLLTLIDNVTDEGLSSYRIDTQNATYYYQKVSGGFSSIIDSLGHDWLNYDDATFGAGGTFRGIPNSVFPEGSLHPGATDARSVVEIAGPLRIIIRSTTLDGRFGIRWEIYPDHATATITKALAYWFLYEGTPGGTLDMARTQWFVPRVSPTSSARRGEDIPGDEWVYFADGPTNKSLFLAITRTTTSSIRTLTSKG
ncbi:MAG: hypothetical protein R2705_10725 [Ilumatobacteraceae bacterium]